VCRLFVSISATSTGYYGVRGAPDSTCNRHGIRIPHRQESLFVSGRLFLCSEVRRRPRALPGSLSIPYSWGRSRHHAATDRFALVEKTRKTKILAVLGTLSCITIVACAGSVCAPHGNGLWHCRTLCMASSISNENRSVDNGLGRLSFCNST